MPQTPTAHRAARLGRRRPVPRLRRARGHVATCRSPSRRAGSPSSSDPTPAASRRCCGRSPACSSRSAAPCCSTARRSTVCRPARSPRRWASCRSPRSPRTASPSPTSSAAGATRTRGGSGSGPPPTRAAVDDALEATGTADLADRLVDELSGGQRQRVWIAMTLAQGTGLLLLDEPTTYLDLAHQVEVLDLLVDLNQREGRTIVLVLHDLNHACRYAHHLIAMRDGGDRRRGLARRHRHTRAGHRRVRGAAARSSPTRCRHADGRADRAPPPRRDGGRGRTIDDRLTPSPSSPRSSSPTSTTSTPTGRSSSVGRSASLPRRRAGDRGRSRPSRCRHRRRRRRLDAPRPRRLPERGREHAAAASARCRPGGRGACRDRVTTTLTSLELQAAELAAIRTFITTVRRDEDRSPGGSARSRSAAATSTTFVPLAADQFLYVLAPPPGRHGADDRRQLHVGAVRHDAARRAARSAPTTRSDAGGPRPASWTCCSCSTAPMRGDPARLRLGRRALRPGDPVALWGPRTAFDPPAGTDWYLLVADDTGLPAVAAIIESLSPGTPVQSWSPRSTPRRTASRSPSATASRCTGASVVVAPAGTTTAARRRRPLAAVAGRGTPTPGVAPRAAASPPSAGTCAWSEASRSRRCR